ncbi:hypothetical protein B7P43_G10412 [Cryptotermes secundus]|uniref:Methyltransferase type 11 domain-containing protein n=1 Tax=Cryptotermes secundus TaxID=105785 RepID=A0A2J7QEN4_9NEOP|nr:hypothetical protein B7P43_G10412 [Cryptotermes secundus]
MCRADALWSVPVAAGRNDKRVTGRMSGAEEREARSVALEKAYVHEVYEQISGAQLPAGASADSQRGRAWPKVKQFLSELEPGSLVCDVGCGNGKYLNVNPSVFKIGVDRCCALMETSREKEHEVLLCDNLSLPFRDESFDAVLSVAVVHHFATTERRVGALRELARVLRIGGRLIITVWAMKQRHRKFQSQDVLVPWHRPQHLSTPSLELTSTTTTTSEEDGPPPYHAYTQTSDSDSCRSARLDASQRKRGRSRHKGRSIDPARPCSSSQSSSSLSSPNETCYSFVRRALQKLAGGKRGGSGHRPWFLDSWSSCTKEPPPPHRYDPEGCEDGEGEGEDIQDLPIELRRLEEDQHEPPQRRQTFACARRATPHEVVLNHKSKSLSDILTVGQRAMVRSRSSVPSLGVGSENTAGTSDLASAAPTATNTNNTKPRLVKQKKSVCEEMEEEGGMRDLVKALPEFKVPGTGGSQRYGNVFKQSSMNEELMSAERLREKERVRQNIQKQASLNEELIYRSHRTLDSLRDTFFNTSTAKRFQLLKNGLTSKLKSSTTGIEKVAGTSFKNGFVRILQGWKGGDVSPNTRPSATPTPSDAVPPCTPPPDSSERRHSREDGSDSSKDSSLQSDTSVDSEDSFASVIFMPKPDPTTTPPKSPQPTSPNIKQQPTSPSPQIKLSPPSLSPRTPLIEEKPLEEEEDVEEQELPPDEEKPPADELRHSERLRQIQELLRSRTAPVTGRKAVKSSQADFLYSSVLLKLTVCLLYSSMLLLSSCLHASAATTTRNCYEHSWTLTYITAERTCITGNTCHVITTNCCVTSPRTRKTQLPILFRFGPCFMWRNETLAGLIAGAAAVRNPFPLVRRSTAMVLGRPEPLTRPLPRLLSLELFNPETDDMDSDSSGVSSPDSVSSVISVLTEEPPQLVTSTGTTQGTLGNFSVSLFTEPPVEEPAPPPESLCSPSSLPPPPPGNTTTSPKASEIVTERLLLEVQEAVEEETGSSECLTTEQAPRVSPPSLSLLEAAADVASSLEDAVDAVIQSSPRARRRKLQLAENSDAMAVLQGSGCFKQRYHEERPDDTWDENCRQHLADFAEKLSEKLLEEIDQYQKQACQQPPRHNKILDDHYLSRLSEELQDLSKLSKELQDRNSYLTSFNSNPSILEMQPPSLVIQDPLNITEIYEPFLESTLYPDMGVEIKSNTVVLDFCKQTKKTQPEANPAVSNESEEDLSNASDVMLVCNSGSRQTSDDVAEDVDICAEVLWEIPEQTGTSGSDCSRRDTNSADKTVSTVSVELSDAVTGSGSDFSRDTHNADRQTPCCDGRSSSEEVPPRSNTLKAVTQEPPDVLTKTESCASSLSGSTSQESLPSDNGGGAITFHRYYHVFREGELDQLIERYVENLHIISSYYDHANWCVVAEKVHVWTI